ncbi:glycosyltransferase family 39 protein [Candidatus Woesearchaeota archaeon]|nr:glycosyltransferase family 39 protein [Candidatus Woesearchaeota archaeon]
MNFLKKFKYTDYYTKSAILIIALGFIIRFALIFLYHPSGDACWHLSVSRFMADNLKIPLLEPLGREVFWEPPVFHIISSLFYRIFSIFGSGVAEFSLKLVSPIFGSLSLIMTFLIMSGLFGKKTAFYSAIFATFLPINIFYGTIAYTESLMTFFVLLSLYLMMKERHILSAVAFGVSLLSKYNALFTLPLIIYFMYKNNKQPKEFVKKFLIFGIIAGLIFLPWLARNYLYLHNPLWPFFTSVFGGYESAETFKGNNISSLWSINNLAALYLGVFGVPEGNYQNIFYFKVPFIHLFFAAWLLATVVFTVPLFFSFRKKGQSSKIKSFLLLWLAPHLLLVALYVINTGIAYSRLLVPAVPLFSAMWGLGFIYLLDRMKKFRATMIFVLIVLVIGFSAAEFVKAALAGKEWNFYQKDFDWAKKNTGKDSVFIAGGQCMSYNLQRFTLNPAAENLDKANYAFVNQNFRLDYHVIFDEQTLKSMQSRNYSIAYFNKSTGTTIYYGIKR